MYNLTRECISRSKLYAFYFILQIHTTDILGVSEVWASSFLVCLLDFMHVGNFENPFLVQDTLLALLSWLLQPL